MKNIFGNKEVNNKTATSKKIRELSMNQKKLEDDAESAVEKLKKN